jgi:hypothetical protein
LVSEGAAALAGAGVSGRRNGGGAGGGEAAAAKLADDRQLDALLERSRDSAGAQRLTAKGSMVGELVRAVPERALESELTARLAFGKDGRREGGNARTGSIAKTVQSGVWPGAAAGHPRPAGSFEPVLAPKRAGQGRRGSGRHGYQHLRGRYPWP